MATRSRISFERPDGKIRSIYCHWDGYPSNNGKILLKHYNADNLDALMDLGDLSVLGTTPVSNKEGWENSGALLDTQCLAYKDRGEEDVDALEFANMKDFVDHVPQEEYNYLFMDGNWYVWEETYGDSPDIEKSQLKMLEAVLADVVS